MKITGGNGTASGLVDSQTGLNDILFQSGNTITGFVGHTSIVAFTITLNSQTGEVTFTEDRAVTQSQDGSDPSGIAASFTAGVVALTQTITDGDGSTGVGEYRPWIAAFDHRRWSQDPDGAFIRARPDRQRDAPHGEDQWGFRQRADIFLTAATGNFSVAFHDNPGADGLKAVAYTLTAGSASGLVDSQTHQTDVLVQTNATTITGYVGSQASGIVAFTITVDAFGNVTFTEDRAVVQTQNGHDPSQDLASLTAGAVTLTQTITDNDGTTTSASLDISKQLSISDDGPSISLSLRNEAVLTVSEANLQSGTNGVDGTVHNGQITATGNFSSNFSDTFGADGAAKTGSVGYALTLASPPPHSSLVFSGLTDSQTGQKDYLVMNNNGVIEGHVGSNTGALAFTISIDPATGLVTFTEDRAVVQEQNGQDPSGITASLSSGVVFVTQTITDGDGTSTSANLDIGQQLVIKDDGPQIAVTAANEPVLTLSESNLTSTLDDNKTPGTTPDLGGTTITQGFSGVFTDTFGADGQAQSGAVSYALTLNGVTRTHTFIDSGLKDTLTGGEIYLHQTGNTITGYAGQSTTDPVVFTIQLNTSTGQVTFDLDRSVENNGTGTAGVSIGANLISLTQTITDGDATSTSGQINIGAQFSITDDTPIVSLTNTPVTAMSVSEANLPSTNGDNNTPGTSPSVNNPSATEHFTGSFSDNFGADGKAGNNAITHNIAPVGLCVVDWVVLAPTRASRIR